MKRKLVAAAILVFSAVLFSTFPQVHGIQVSITASGDTYVSSDEPTVNRGNSVNVFVYNETNELGNTSAYEGWLKFNLSEIPSNAIVSSAVLRMHTGLSGTGTVSVGVFLCNDTSWNEYTLTWNTTPPLSSPEPFTTLNVSSSGGDYDFNVTSVIRGGNMLCLVLKIVRETELGVGQVQFLSRESDNPPKLIVVYAMEEPPFDWSLAAALAAFLIVVPTAVGIYLYRRVKKTPKT